MSDSDRSVRIATAIAIGTANFAELLSGLIERIEAPSESSEVRLACLEAVKTIGDGSVSSRLSRLMQQKEVPIAERKKMADLLILFGWSPETFHEAILLFALAGRTDVILREYGESSLQTILDLLTQAPNDRDLILSIVRALNLLDWATIPEPTKVQIVNLIAQQFAVFHLEKGNENEWIRSLRTIGHPSAVAAVYAHYVKISKTGGLSDSPQRLAEANLIPRLGAAILLGAINDGDREVRRVARSALSRIDLNELREPRSLNIKALCTFLETAAEPARICEAIKTLETIVLQLEYSSGLTDELASCVRVIAGALLVKEDAVRETAGNSLKRLGAQLLPSERVYLAAHLRDWESIRKEGAPALGPLTVYSRITNLWGYNGSDNLRLAELLFSIGDERALDLFLQGLCFFNSNQGGSADNPKVNLLIRQTLVRIGSAAALRLVSFLSGDWRASVRDTSDAAVALLIEIRAPRTVPMLVDLLIEQKDRVPPACEALEGIYEKSVDRELLLLGEADRIIKLPDVLKYCRSGPVDLSTLEEDPDKWQNLSTKRLKSIVTIYREKNLVSTIRIGEDGKALS